MPQGLAIYADNVPVQVVQGLTQATKQALNASISVNSSAPQITANMATASKSVKRWCRPRLSRGSVIEPK